MAELRGVCCALCTPFTDRGSLDLNGLKKHLDRILAGGVPIILVCGGTGEFPFLSREERRKIAETAARHLKGKARLIVHSSATRTEECIEYAKHAEGLGADCVLVLPPYFEGPREDGVYHHYERTARAVKIPIMTYNIPVHSGFDITPRFFKRLLQIENIRYLKDSTADIVRLQALVATGGGIFDGGDPTYFFGLLAGCAGCVLGGANIFPEETVRIHDLIQAGKVEEAKKLWEKLFPANLFIWTHPYNPSVKAAVNLGGGKVGDCRKPVLPLTGKEMAELKKALAAAGR
jgi:4-hydroxy-tetrahydrodipicolinate synthase